jgi:HD-GYP domain-containing protein (c-di-GMP phosphodiesterase class II)
MARAESGPQSAREASERLGDRDSDAVAARPGGAYLWRYLPLVLLTTFALTALPVEIATTVLPRSGEVLSVVASAALAIAIAMILANLAAAGWMRRRGSRDVLFSELILWGWSRRLWTEWRLRRARAEYESVTKSSPHVSIELLERVTRLLQARDPHTHGHSQRVARHAVRIARTMSLPAAEVAKIRTAAAIHDVGKLYTPREILNNPNQLSDEEFEIVKRHAADGADMVGPAGDGTITAMVRHHHERLSGNGYPDGLLGEQIPLGARIIAVADTFDAITSTRPYRPAASHKSALDVLAKESGTQLDAAAVAAFRQSYSGRRTVAWTALASALPARALAWLQASGAGVGLNSLPQVLPVVGAAGALALAHGHSGHRAITRHGARQAASAQAHRVTASTPVTGKPTGGHPKRIKATRQAAAPPLEGGPTKAAHPQAGFPNTTRRGSGSGPAGSGPRGGSGGSTDAGPTSSPPTRTTPSTTSTSPPPPPPPAPEAPVSIPTVSTPTISTPTVPLPLPLPPVSVKVPGVKVSSPGSSSGLSVEAGI